MTKDKSLAIINGHIIDPAERIDMKADIFIKEGQIIQIGDKVHQADETIDARDMIICPGLVDLSHNLREPGQKNKGSIASESYAAASGGVTTLCCPPDTLPVIDNSAVVKSLLESANQDSYARIYLLGAVSKGLKGEQLTEMHNLIQAGCVGLSNGLFPIKNTEVMLRVLEYASGMGITVFIYPMDYWLSHDGCAHEGIVSSRLGLKGIPDSAESIALQRDLELIELTGARVHFCHISSAKGIEIIRQAKKRALPVTADVTINHLHLTDMDIGFFESNCHSIPPFRTIKDRDALLAGLEDDTIDAIVSAHQPHDADAKLAPFAETEPGLSSVETLLALALKTADQSGLSVSRILGKLTYEPARVLSLPLGRIGIGRVADLCIYQPDYFWSVDPVKLHSHGKNTPYGGWEMSAKVTHTIVAGKHVYNIEKQADKHACIFSDADLIF